MPSSWPVVEAHTLFLLGQAAELGLDHLASSDWPPQRPHVPPTWARRTGRATQVRSGSAGVGGSALARAPARDWTGTATVAISTNCAPTRRRVPLRLGG